MEKANTQWVLKSCNCFKIMRRYYRIFLFIYYKSKFWPKITKKYHKNKTKSKTKKHNKSKQNKKKENWKRKRKTRFLFLFLFFKLEPEKKKKKQTNKTAITIFLTKIYFFSLSLICWSFSQKVGIFSDKCDSTVRSLTHFHSKNVYSLQLSQ